MGFNSGFKGLKWKRRGYKAYLFLLSHTTMHGSMNVKLVLCIIRYGVWCFWCNVWKVHLLREKSGLKWKNVGTKLTYFWHSAWYPDVLCTTHHHKHQRLDPLILSVSRVTTAVANVSSVFQLFFFLVVCNDMISKGFGLVAFFASVKASFVCIHSKAGIGPKGYYRRR